MPEKLMLVDGHSIINRGFYALPLLTNQAGEYTNAVYGFLNIFLKLFDEESPEYVIVAFDVRQPTFRHERYAEYKGTRKPMPDELRPQVPLLKQTLATMGICMAEYGGFEADDVLGTLAVQASELGLNAVIVTGDRDLLQLAGETIQIRIPKTKGGKTEVENYHANDVLERLGVTPKAYIDVKALMGDTSDNIPGVPGIGEVTATKFIAAYGSLENTLAHVDELPKKASENLQKYREQALLSKDLATIRLDAPVIFNQEEARVGDIWNETAHQEFVRLEFKTLLPRFRKNETATYQASVRVIDTESEAAAFFSSQETHPPRKGENASIHQMTLDEQPDYDDAVAFHLLTDQGRILGLGIAHADHETVYLAIGSNLPEHTLLALAKPFFSSATPKLMFDSKSEGLILHKLGLPINNIIFDAMLAGYVLNATQPGLTVQDIAFDYLNETLPTIEDLLDNKGKKSKDRKTISDLPTSVVANYAGRIADVIQQVYPVMCRLIRDNHQWALYCDIELPLAGILKQMEITGIKTDPEALTSYGLTLNKHIETLTGDIHALAGEPFNILSPAQLGIVLFEKLGLKGTKKTTQGYSTAADVLEKLIHLHPIVPLVIEYRTYTKLKSTYADGLLQVIDPLDSRIHSTFHQALTATGRISSAEPNLQNIPIRMPLGRQLRKAFVPEDEDTIFIDADYSQIELRVLAHMSGDPTLINAFLEGQDIHRLTASQVFHVPPEAVTSEQRGNAKAVNFGIVYGISAFGLSEDLGIPKKEAERYIQGYFEKYPRVKEYLDESIERARKDGYAVTMFNRRRAVPELSASNFVKRSFGERVAMNMPIQGSAADIIKIAMINVTRRLERERLNARLVLQVHDELLLEVKKTDKDYVKRVLKEEMEHAAKLSAPLVADLHEGKTWYDAK